MSIFEEEDDLDFGEGETDLAGDDDLEAAGIADDVGPFDDGDLSDDD